MSPKYCNHTFILTFPRFKLMKQISSDNVTALTLDEFKAFLKFIRIIHFTGAPFYRYLLTIELDKSGVKIVKNAFKKVEFAGEKYVCLMIHKFLFHYRYTPHTATDDPTAKYVFT